MDNLGQHVQTQIGIVAGDELPGSILRPSTDRLKEEVGLDSLDAVELILNLQEAFDLTIPDKEAQQLKTVGDVIEYVRGRMH